MEVLPVSTTPGTSPNIVLAGDFFFLLCSRCLEEGPAVNHLVLIDLTGGGGRAEEESCRPRVSTAEERIGEEELRDVDAEAVKFCRGNESR